MSIVLNNDLKIAKIAVLVSGGGTNLQALIDAEKNGTLKHGNIIHVISSKDGAYALERAKNAGIKISVAEFKDFKNNLDFENKILDLLNETKPDIIVLAGFMHILSANFVDRYKGRMVNVHPSLIPAFCGKGFYGLKVHEAVLKAGVKITGATVHLVNDVPDGGEILKQKAVEVFDNDTPEILQRRVMEQAEWKILPEAVEELCMESITLQSTSSTAPLRGEPRIEARGEAKPIERGLKIKGNKYPGRGVMIGCDNSGRLMFAYFIMGRSASSRARVFKRDNDDLIIKIIDKEKVQDASLILYAPVRVLNNYLIVTNGDQTDTIYDFINHDKTFEEALRTREFEPDAPHFTPRISGILDLNSRRYKLSILKSCDLSLPSPERGGKVSPSGGDVGKADREGLDSPLREVATKSTEGCCLREFFEYEAQAGVAHLIHTYENEGDGKILPSFKGEPKIIENISDNIDYFANNLWDALDGDNKVSLYVRYINHDNTFEDRIFNKYE